MRNSKYTSNTTDLSTSELLAVHGIFADTTEKNNHAPQENFVSHASPTPRFAQLALQMPTVPSKQENPT